MKMKHPLCTVGRETKRMLSHGHPWIIADRFTSRWPKLECGSLINLQSEEGVYLGTALCEPEARIIARRLSREEITLDENWLMRQFERALQSRRWLQHSDTTVLRLVNAEGDGLPGLTVDRYNEHLLIQYYTLAWVQHLPLVARALQEVFSPLGIYAKHRPQETRKLAGKNKTMRVKGYLLSGTRASKRLIVHENNLKYFVEIEGGLHTGLFHDQRQNRAEFRRLSAGCRVLNLFSYTGAFSVAAAAGGAALVTSIDASDRYLAWAKENFRLNDISIKPHEFIAGDCFEELDRLHKQGRTYDIILTDPPSFSSTKKSNFTTSGGTSGIIERALKILETDGLLIASSNLQKMLFPDYLKELRKGSDKGSRYLQIIKLAGQAEDFPFTDSFPEGNYLKYVVAVAKEKI